MIYEHGNFQPTKRQLALIKQFADESFCQCVPEGFGDVPLPAGFRYSPNELTALTLKNVEPHDDPWVGDHEDGDGLDGPDDRRAMFWLLSTAKHHSIHLQCGTMSAKMKAGDWVLFDDRILHGVYSTKTWFGLAYQLRPSGVPLPAADSGRLTNPLEDRV